MKITESDLRRYAERYVDAYTTSTGGFSFDRVVEGMRAVMKEMDVEIVNQQAVDRALDLVSAGKTHIVRGALQLVGVVRVSDLTTAQSKKFLAVLDALE